MRVPGADVGAVVQQERPPACSAVVNAVAAAAGLSMAWGCVARAWGSSRIKWWFQSFQEGRTREWALSAGGGRLERQTSGETTAAPKTTQIQHSHGTCSKHAGVGKRRTGEAGVIVCRSVGVLGSSFARCGCAPAPASPSHNGFSLKEGGKFCGRWIGLLYVVAGILLRLSPTLYIS